VPASFLTSNGKGGAGFCGTLSRGPGLPVVPAPQVLVAPARAYQAWHPPTVLGVGPKGSAKFLKNANYKTKAKTYMHTLVSKRDHEFHNTPSPREERRKRWGRIARCLEVRRLKLTQGG
jgi:hypothetical protein